MIGALNVNIQIALELGGDSHKYTVLFQLGVYNHVSPDVKVAAVVCSISRQNSTSGIIGNIDATRWYLMED